MDAWRHDLLQKLVPLPPSETTTGAPARPSTMHLAETALEIALGHARSEITYVLELGRAHGLPFAGHVHGDDVWLVLGDGRAMVRFAYDRRHFAIAVRAPGQDERKVAWDDKSSALTCSGAPFDDDQMRTLVRASIDAAVAAWKATPVRERPRWDANPPSASRPALTTAKES